MNNSVAETSTVASPAAQILKCGPTHRRHLPLALAISGAIFSLELDKSALGLKGR